jgi:hypothetical protein
MTLCFPQLSTGAIAQFPFEVRLIRRTVVNQCADGSLIRYAEPAPSLLAWHLQYVGLTDSELDPIRTLFNTASGRLRTFVFLDPAANLLRADDEFGADCWYRDPLLLVRPSDGEGPVGARTVELTNAGQSDQHVGQTLNAPAAMEYTFSFYARSCTPIQVEAAVAARHHTVTQVFPLGSEWRRCICTTSNLDSGDEISFSLGLPAAAVVEVCGLQVEAQTGVSEYHPSSLSGGIYRNTRFASDKLQVTTHGENDHSAEIELISRVEP